MTSADKVKPSYENSTQNPTWMKKIEFFCEEFYEVFHKEFGEEFKKRGIA